MKGLYITAITAFIGITAANFVWQAFTGQAWGVAIERSWFQLGAIVILTRLLVTKQTRSPITKE